MLFGSIRTAAYQQSSKSHHRVLGNPSYFNHDYFSTLSYDYLNGQTLLSTVNPLLCVRETELFGCQRYSTPDYVNVTHFLATRLTIDYKNNIFPIHNIISMFDWLFVSPSSNAEKYTLDEGSIVWFGQGTKPRTIFVENFVIPYFVQSILPNIQSRFVLYSGHNDFTVPYNIDARWEYDSSVYQKAWNTLIASDKVVHWFNENHVVAHPKVSTMPIGMNPKEFHPDDISDHPTEVVPLEKRPFKMLQLDKVRKGEQWVERKEVHEMCQQEPNLCFTGTKRSFCIFR